LPSGAKFCPGCGKPVQASGDPATPAKSIPLRKQVTVLFADFSGFTAFAHKRDAEDVRDFMSSVWANLDGIIAAHGGSTEKHIGDAIMAVFGAQQAREEDPAQAVRAAVAMQNWLKETRTGSAAVPMQMRIGVHTGLAVVGPLGSLGEVTVTGDTVNLASRLQTSAPVGGVLVSHDTYRHIHGFFDVQTLPPFEVKGRPELVQTYVILRTKPRALAMQLRGVEGVRAEMVGRQKEMQFLQAAFERLVGGQRSEMLTVIGEAGIGKSCLVSQFQEWVELRPETVRFFYGRANPQSAALPFSLMRDVFANRFEIQDTDPSAMARQKLERGIVELLAGTSETSSFADNGILHAHFIGQLLGLDFASSPWLREILNDPSQIRHRAFESIARFFTAVTGDSFPPLSEVPIKGALLLVEDMHWSDDGSLDLLAHLATACREVPLLILGLARPTLLERRPHWGKALSNHQRLDLQPLQRRESIALVESLLRHASQIPQALRELIVGGAEGIPFYIEEIIKMLIDQKVIIPGPEQWHIEPEGLATARVPPTLMGVLQARLDSLQPVERLVLQRAAVVGRAFWDSALQHLSRRDVDAESVKGSKGLLSRALSSQGGEGENISVLMDKSTELASTSITEPSLQRPEILSALDTLRQKELIFRRESSNFAASTEYAFKHELLRNVAYESLLKKSRRFYHGRLAGWLIEQGRERINEVAALVANHFEQAGQVAEAAEWFGRAGHQAQAGYAPASAIEQFQKALTLLPTEESRETQINRMNWLAGLVDVLGAQARFNEALEICQQFRVLAEQLSQTVMQARALNGQAFLCERLSQNRASVEAAQQAEALARAAGESGKAEWIRALLLKGWAFYRLSDAGRVRELGEQARALCVEFDNRLGLATSLKLLGVGQLQLAHFEEADLFFQQGLGLYEQLGDRRNSAAMLSNLGESARYRGDYQRAEQLYEQATAAVREIGHRESEAIYLANLSAARLGLRKYEQAERDVREALALLEGSTFCALSETYVCLSQACLGQGKVKEALGAVYRALEMARESGSDLDLGTAWRSLGQVVAAWDNNQLGALPAYDSSPAPEPHACFVESHRIFQKIKAESEAARTLQAWADFDLKNGRHQEGRQKLEEAQSIFRRLGALAHVE
jgi:predicted ATPase/class 3 adenylate cyclase